jgi:hypothetical protein
MSFLFSFVFVVAQFNWLLFGWCFFVLRSCSGELEIHVVSSEDLQDAKNQVRDSYRSIIHHYIRGRQSPTSHDGRCRSVVHHVLIVYRAGSSTSHEGLGRSVVHKCVSCIDYMGAGIRTSQAVRRVVDQ